MFKVIKRVQNLENADALKAPYFRLQRITATVNTQEQKRLLMDLDISMRSSACSYTVQFYGALFREGDVWICMEVMDMSLDKFYTKVYKYGRAIPEDILGKVAFAVHMLLVRIFSNVIC